MGFVGFVGVGLLGWGESLVSIVVRTHTTYLVEEPREAGGGVGRAPVQRLAGRVGAEEARAQPPALGGRVDGGGREVDAGEVGLLLLLFLFVV